MNSNIILTLIIAGLIVMIIILLKNNQKVSHTNPTDDIKKQNELLLQLLDSKLSGQSNLMTQASKSQNMLITDKINFLDSNMTKTNKQIENIIRTLFEDLSTTQNRQAKLMNEKNTEFEKQLVKIGTLDESLETLKEKISDLSKVLGNAKARGSFGEIQMYQIIDNQFGLNNKAIVKQDKLENGTIVDLSIETNSLGRKLCIDSKFPLENFLEYNENGLEEYKKLFERDIKKHINDINAKYIISGETVNFAIMFIPSESIYLEIMGNEKLVEYSYRQKVWFASPTTLIALITMLENINTDYKREKNIELIEKEMVKLSVEFERFDKRYSNISKHIIQVLKDFEEITVTQKKITKKFDEIKNMEMEVENDE